MSASNAGAPRVFERARAIALLRRVTALVPVFMLLAGIAIPAPATWAEDRAPARIDAAVEAYGEAMESEDRERRLEGFRRSERLFRAAVESGVENAELYANLGNAALQAEHLGPAVLAYRRALRLQPGLERAQQNLQHARTLLPEWVPTPAGAGLLDSFFVWHRTTSTAYRANLAALAFAVAILCIAGSIYFRVGPPRYVAIPAALVWIALIASLAFDPARDAWQEGVVVVEEATARSADSINAPRRFGDLLPGGTEVRILEDRGGWLQIELYNGRNAWLTASNVERIALQ
jgi:tetratricopeptide (TPR) repeat protein